MTQRAAGVRELIETAGGRATVLLANLSDLDAVRSLISRVSEAIGDSPLEVLINNAGGGKFALTEETSEAMFDTAFTTHVKAPYLLVAAFAPAMADFSPYVSVQNELSASAVSVIPGGAIESLTVDGSLRTHGDNVVTLEVAHDARIGTLNIAGDIEALGTGSTATRIDGDVAIWNDPTAA